MTTRNLSLRPRPRNGQEEPRGRRDRPIAEAEPGDEIGAWTHTALVKMDREFAERMRAALELERG